MINIKGIGLYEYNDLSEEVKETAYEEMLGLLRRHKVIIDFEKPIEELADMYGIYFSQEGIVFKYNLEAIGRDSIE